MEGTPVFMHMCSNAGPYRQVTLYGSDAIGKYMLWHDLII